MEEIIHRLFYYCLRDFFNLVMLQFFYRVTLDFSDII